MWVENWIKQFVFFGVILGDKLGISIFFFGPHSQQRRPVHSSAKMALGPLDSAVESALNYKCLIAMVLFLFLFIFIF